MKVELTYESKLQNNTQKVQELFYESEEDNAPRVSLISMQGYISMHYLSNIKTIRIRRAEPDPEDVAKTKAMMNFTNDLLAFLSHDRLALSLMSRFIRTHPTTWKAIRKYTKEFKNDA